MQDINKKLDKALEKLKDFGQFKHLFSDDDAERELAELRQTIGEIKFNLDLSKIKEVTHPEKNPIKEYYGDKTGTLVAIRPCNKKYENKTYLGVLIGEVALGTSVKILDDKIVCEYSSYNPGILVPELNEVIYGCGSWWHTIRSKDDLKNITKKDINNIWYVQALKQIDKSE